MVSEYRALRASVLKLWKEAKKESDDTGLEELTRFNEAIDQALTEFISHYAIKLDEFKNLFWASSPMTFATPLVQCWERLS